MAFIEFISNWILQITIFMLLAFLVDLILPNTNLKQYVKLVIGILLIMIIIEPLFSVFKQDADDLIDQVVFSNQRPMVENNIENEMKNKKNEIESLQSAYVLEEVLVQMKNKVEEELQKKYEAQIKHIDANLEDETSQKQKVKNFTSISVLLDTSTDPSSNNVEEVTIQIGDSNLTSESSERSELLSEKSTRVKAFLAEEWGVKKAVITIKWKEE